MRNAFVQKQISKINRRRAQNERQQQRVVLVAQPGRRKGKAGGNIIRQRAQRFFPKARECAQ